MFYLVKSVKNLFGQISKDVFRLLILCLICWQKYDYFNQEASREKAYINKVEALICCPKLDVVSEIGNAPKCQNFYRILNPSAP